MPGTAPSFRERLRYRFDETLSSGTTAMIVWLSLATLALILLVSLVATIADIQANGSGMTFVETLWQNFLRAMDPGTMGADEGWAFRIASLITTVGGILIFSTLIGLLANGIGERVAELRRGRSPILESGHTLILGWSPKIYPIVSELSVANENLADASVVVLAPMERDLMDERLSSRVPDMRTTRTITRTGIPYEPADLEIARPQYAKSIILLNPGGDDGDAEVVKASLALLRILAGAPETPVVAEIHDAASAAALAEGTHGAITVVRPADIIARVTAQVCRTPGLSAVYQELFDFDGDEIYFHSDERLTGLTFGDALLSFGDSSPLGIRYADGRVELSPPQHTTFGRGDQIISIAEDDDRIRIDALRQIHSAPRNGARPPADTEATLLIGWNDMAQDIIRELDTYVAAGSTLHVAVDPSILDASTLELPGDLRNLTLHLVEGGVNRKTLYPLMETHRFDHALVLCYRDLLTEAQADARVLLTLLHLRSAIDQIGTDTNIVAELMDERDVQLTPGDHANEFIVSERLTALFIAQLSENRDLAPVFQDLLDEDGVEIYLKPADLYIEPGHSTTFAAVVAGAARRGEVAFGYQAADNGASRVVVNPARDKGLVLTAADRVIVLAEDDD